jgi:hypothetical protein
VVKKKLLLGLESLLTAAPFVVSWMLCAIALSVKAGYLMAKASPDQRAKALDTLWTGTDPSEPPRSQSSDSP